MDDGATDREGQFDSIGEKLSREVEQFRMTSSLIDGTDTNRVSEISWSLSYTELRRSRLDEVYPHVNPIIECCISRVTDNATEPQHVCDQKVSGVSDFANPSTVVFLQRF